LSLPFGSGRASVAWQRVTPSKVIFSEGEKSVRAVAKVFLTVAVSMVWVRAADAQIAASRSNSCAQTLPAGLVIRIEPDEKILAGKTDGPLLLTVTSDVRLFPGKPPIVPRSSKVFARTVESKQAGRLWGRAHYEMSIDTILTPNECEYSIDAKLIEAGKYKVKKSIVGKGHARRDALLWLFPPTTLYQLIRLPARGPKLILDEESSLAIRLLQPVHLQQSDANAGSVGRNAYSEGPQKPEVVIEAASTECDGKPVPGLYNPVQLRSMVIRPVRNLTPYSISLVVGRETTTIGPCFGAMVATPMNELTISAKASIPEAGGQSEIPLQIKVNSAGTGWDVIKQLRAGDANVVAAQLKQQ
jgi:hypothetical protein